MQSYSARPGGTRKVLQNYHEFWIFGLENMTRPILVLGWVTEPNRQITGSLQPEASRQVADGGPCAGYL